MCPGNHESAGKRTSGRTRKGDAALRAALCEAAWSASRTRDTYLSAHYWHLLRRFGKKGQAKAAFAVGHTLLVIIWHLLARDRDYHDLGADHYDRRSDAKTREHYHIRQLEALGHKVSLGPAA